MPVCLVTQDNAVEVAHEAVFRSWVWLKNWIAEAQEDLILLRQVRAAANDWARHDQPDAFRWPQSGCNRSTRCRDGSSPS